MEQKDAYEQGLSRSNRTFMELKYLEQLPARIAEQSSNRTFMELK